MIRPFAAAALVAAASCLFLSSSGSAQPKPSANLPQDACFFPRNIESFHAADDHTVYLRVGVTDYYKLDLMGSCPDLTFAEGIGLRHDRGDVTICSALGTEVIVRLHGSIPQYCPVATMRKLSTPEVALLGKNKP